MESRASAPTRQFTTLKANDERQALKGDVVEKQNLWTISMLWGGILAGMLPSAKSWWLCWLTQNDIVLRGPLACWLKYHVSGAAAASSGRTRTGNNGGLWRFYTEDSTGLKIGPVPVLVMSLVFIASVFVLHIWGKFTRSRAWTPQSLLVYGSLLCSSK